jgi:glycosyl transferase family 87
MIFRPQNVVDRLTGETGLYDLSTFLRAAGDVVSGRSPYYFQGDQTYAYPPLLAVLLIPLAPLEGTGAQILWAIASIGAVMVSLRLLGVSDWRCYGLAFLFPITRYAIGTGTINPFLLLGIALVWRFRDRVLIASAVAGFVVALKLFLWPIAVWFAITGRWRAAAATAGFALAFVLVPWAGLGFSGLTEYPGLLERLVDDVADASYSVFAVGAHLAGDDLAGTALSLAVAGLLLAGALHIASGSSRSARERDAASLSLVIGSAIAASPIVWLHYYLLLLVPLALARPRLSALWLVPFVFYPLGQGTSWANGDMRRLAVALGASAAVFVVAALHGGRTAEP